MSVTALRQSQSPAASRQNGSVVARSRRSATAPEHEVTAFKMHQVLGNQGLQKLASKCPCLSACPTGGACETCQQRVQTRRPGEEAAGNGEEQEAQQDAPTSVDPATPTATQDPTESTVSPGATSASAPDSAPSVTESPSNLLIEDAAEPESPSQMKRSEFLAQLRGSVESAVDEALAPTGRSTRDCPYIETWFAFYQGQSSGHIERSVRRYAPETASVATAFDYILLVTERARRAAAVWARTGRITGIPEGLPIDVSGLPASQNAPVLRKARPGHSAASGDLQAVRAQLSGGHDLDSPVRARMESAFGRSFSHVRIHDDAQAGRLSSSVGAKAFTIGSSVAFGTGEYKPGTPVGDALIAHELAHVVQQEGGGGEQGPGGDIAGDSALEQDADTVAAHAVLSLWGGTQTGLRDLSRNALPRLRSGLRLQRCNNRATPTGPPRLQKHTSSGPTARTCGGVTWVVLWDFDHADATTNGWIVQRLDTRFNVTDCASPPNPITDIKTHTGGRIDQAWYPYWEAWQVRGGSVYIGSSTAINTGDVYQTGGLGNNTRGSRDWIGDADFYPGLTLPSSFSVRSGHPAQALPVATSDPGLTGGTGVLAHNMTATWNCCPGSPDRTTGYTTT